MHYFQPLKKAFPISENDTAQFIMSLLRRAGDGRAEGGRRYHSRVLRGNRHEELSPGVPILGQRRSRQRSGVRGIPQRIRRDDRRPTAAVRGHVHAPARSGRRGLPAQCGWQLYAADLHWVEGKQVGKIGEQNLKAGQPRLEFDAQDPSSGTYILQIEVTPAEEPQHTFIEDVGGGTRGRQLPFWQRGVRSRGRAGRSQRGGRPRLRVVRQMSACSLAYRPRRRSRRGRGGVGLQGGKASTRSGDIGPPAGVAAPQAEMTEPPVGATVPQAGVTAPHAGVVAPLVEVAESHAGAVAPQAGAVAPPVGTAKPRLGVIAPLVTIHPKRVVKRPWRSFEGTVGGERLPPGSGRCVSTKG